MYNHRECKSYMVLSIDIHRLILFYFYDQTSFLPRRECMHSYRLSVDFILVEGISTLRSLHGPDLWIYLEYIFTMYGRTNNWVLQCH